MDEPQTIGALLEDIFAQVKTSSSNISDWLTMEFTAEIETDGSDWEDEANV